MRYTPSLPPLAGVPDTGEVQGLRQLRAVRLVHGRVFPERIAEHNPVREAAIEQLAPVKEEKREDKERRRLCRRLAPADPLLETRSSVERRRKNRRQDDTATSVDEEA